MPQGGCLCGSAHKGKEMFVCSSFAVCAPLRSPSFPESRRQSRALPKSDGSRERSEPWSKGGGSRQLCWLFISTTPKRRKVGSRELSLKPTAVASVASRGARAEGADSFAGCSSPRRPSGERTSPRNQKGTGACKAGLYESAPRIPIGRLPHVLGRKLPVNEFLQNPFDVVCAPVLVVQIVGVLPHVNCEQGF